MAEYIWLRRSLLWGLPIIARRMSTGYVNGGFCSAGKFGRSVRLSGGVAVVMICIALATVELEAVRATGTANGVGVAEYQGLGVW